MAPAVFTRSPVFRSSMFAAAITLAVAITGLFGSLYTDEIKSAFPFYWGRGAIEWKAVFFWGALTLSTVSYWLRQVSIDSARERSEKEFRESASHLEAQSRKLEDIYRTLPPDDFLDAFNRSHSECSSVVYELLRGDETG